MAQTRPAIQLHGEKELIRSLRKVDKRLPKEVAVIHKKVAEPVARDAAGRVNSKSGRLAGDVRALGSQKAGRVAAGRASVPYAGVNHYGWPAHNIEGNPFLTDAIAANQESSLNLYSDLLEAFMEGEWDYP